MRVYAKQYGRTGNQLFQKAAAIGYAMKHGLQYNLTPNVPWRQYHMAIKEAGHQYQELPFGPHELFHNVILDGYFQSEKYFAHCREEVLRAFDFYWMPMRGWCSVHVRRGDYLNYSDKHPFVGVDYLEKAIDYMIVNHEHSQFLFFSDDIEWCKYFVKHGEFAGEFESDFREGFTAEEDIAVMSCCDNHIISNSTFGWWGAWLNREANKVVISPSKDNWFGTGNSHLDTSDLIPDSWIQIKY